MLRLSIMSHCASQGQAGPKGKHGPPGPMGPKVNTRVQHNNKITEISKQSTSYHNIHKRLIAGGDTGYSRTERGEGRVGSHRSEGKSQKLHLSPHRDQVFHCKKKKIWRGVLHPSGRFSHCFVLVCEWWKVVAWASEEPIQDLDRFQTPSINSESHCLNGLNIVSEDFF